MKKLLGALVFVFLAAQLPAQSNEPVRLALISESDEASVASDVLTAQLSGNPKVQLLERNEIEKVYREQGLSVANKDYLKLGRILGADGLLLFDVVRTKAATNLMTRLIAVKPGVVLTDGSFPWPLKDTTSWAESAATYLNSLLPKLALLPKDAIPISVVNLRSAVQSADAQETERQLKLLAIQRLSQERQFFVLERQKMQLLGEEKELKADESAFWNGSYLLEGVVDQNGYSGDVITINARLTPPKGGAPLLFEVSGNRTNFSEVINRLAAKITELLNVSSTVKEWNAADESRQYFDETKWALRWGVFSEAQAAADSAWALGKRDMDCATVRVESYVVPPNTGGYQEGEYTSHRSTNEIIQTIIEEAAPDRLLGLIWNEQDHNGTKVVQYVSVGKFPDPKGIDLAAHALQLYYAYSQTLPPDEPKADSAWYRLGIEDLTVASQVLQHFQFVPEAQKPAADRLGELRATARSVAEWISRSPSVHDSYFVGDRAATHDELSHTIEEQPNLFKCEVTWGCFWQERPEDCIVLYRELMGSPVFRYIHQNFWLRDMQTSRLAAWNENDRERLPMVWNNFVRELETSTNVLLQLESRALRLADAASDKKVAVAFTDLFNSILENRDALVANPVEVLYLDWGVDDLVSAKTGNGLVTATRESLSNLFWHEYRSKLEAMDQEYWDKTLPTQKTLTAFAEQKQFLTENTPYDFFKFVNTFQEKNYSQAQALEIQPLLVAYKSNLVAQSQATSGIQKGQLMGAIAQIGFLEDDVNRILNPPVTQPQPQVQIQVPQPVPIAKAVTAAAVPTNAPEVVTNVLVVNKFLGIPLDGLIRLNGFESIDSSTVTITAHHWLEGKLLLNFNYNLLKNDYGAADGSAIAILDPATEHWDVISCSKEQVTDFYHRSYHRSALLHGDLFNCDGGQIKEYDFQNQQWQVLTVSDGNNYELFAVNGHLYAANGSAVLEIIDGGKGTRILASTRRNPPASILDRENLGTPTLFEGPNHLLRICTASKIFTWTGNDWHEDSAAPPASSQPEIFADGVLFRQAGLLNAGYQNGVLFRQANGTYGILVSQDEIFCLANEDKVAKLCLKGDQGDWRNFSRPGTSPVKIPKPLWETPANLLPNLPAALRQSDLYLLEDQVAVRAIVNDRHEIVEEDTMAKDEYNAVLLCYSHDLPLPQKIFLEFEPSDAQTPAWIFPTTNLLLFAPETPAGIGGGGSGKAGVWLLPVSRLDPAIAAQKQIQLEQITQEEREKVAAAGKIQKDLLAKYDRNHNGVIDADEKEAAITDSQYLEANLSIIVTNSNGLLDAPALRFFDANSNGMLEAPEQKGIETTLALLAQKLVARLNPDATGKIDPNDLPRELTATAKPRTSQFPGFVGGNAPSTQKIDETEVTTLLRSYLVRSCVIDGQRITITPDMLPGGVADPQTVFKARVEKYWRLARAKLN